MERERGKAQGPGVNPYTPEYIIDLSPTFFFLSFLYVSDNSKSFFYPMTSK